VFSDKQALVESGPVSGSYRSLAKWRRSQNEIPGAWSSNIWNL